MKVRLAIRNESERKRLYRSDELSALAERVCTGEMGPGGRMVMEVSLLLCDDGFMGELNARYRGVKGPTDVLSFEQEGPETGMTRLLGDIIVSLETVERRCGEDRRAMRAEVRLLFCHGLLHLLGYDHEEAPRREEMAARQALYLGVESEAAWLSG